MRSSGMRRSTPAVLGLAVAVLRLCWTPLGFLSGLSRPSALQPRAPLASTRASRVQRASRGGEAAQSFAVGDRVKAMSAEDEQWYPGSIGQANADGTFQVKWDDPDGGPETEDVTADHLKKIVIFKDYQVGDDVKATSPDDGRRYPGVVAKINDDGTFQVKWDDPDGGPETNDISPESMKKVIVFKDYKVDDQVEAVFPDDGRMYPGTVTAANGDGTFQVKWEDPDGGPEDSACKPKDMRYPPIPFDKLEVGQKYTGTVRSIMDFGAFCDIGAEKDGLIHLTRISRDRVEDVHDYLEEGQQVDVWVSGKRDDGKFGLTMVEGIVEGGPRRPADLGPFWGLPSEDWHEGRVARIAPFGAFVTVTLESGESADGLVHLTRIRDGFVENVEDELEVGQEVKVRIESVDTEAGRMSLSMKEPWGGAGGGGAPRAPADLSAFEGVASDQWLTGKVARIAPFGAFVTVTAPEGGASADGLVHITQIKDGFVESVEDELEEGQEVQVRVQSVDIGAGRLSLSMKPEDY